MSVCHLFLLFLGFHYATLAAEILEFTIEDLVFSQFAFERPIIERSFDRWFQSYLVKAFLPVTQYPCIIVEELVFESLSNHFVCLQQVWGRYSLAVWWVGHHDGLFGRLCEILEVGLFHRYVSR